MARSIEEQLAALRTAIAALAAVPGAQISVGNCALTETEVETWARLTGGSASKFTSMQLGGVQLLFHFEGQVDGVVVRGQGSRLVSKKEAAAFGDVHSSVTRDVPIDEAFPKRAKRDEFSCPCCGTPTDSSYCDACTKAECGEQDVGAPDRCLATGKAA